ncbi:DUF1499 domain-containing protein [Longirhabdus pacifica]|uniref:DUF1499 domain-containing protein n=1 Tax=Longirhabdus pacifica TaxID=2305227 RepID=UPI001008FA44|nr:DUF1499 domain-containing protein [Longirhabdus pacifica]
MIRRVLSGLIRSVEKTGEDAKDPVLKTRYYSVFGEKAWNETLAAVKQMKDIKVTYEVKNSGEIICEKKSATGRVQDITITLFNVKASKTAIDIHSASRGSLGDLGANYRTIVAIYKVLDKTFR